MKNAYKQLTACTASSLLFLALVLAGNSAAAQTGRHPLSGKVTAAKDNSPLPGASIKVRGTSNGTVTTATGDFTLQVNDADTLEISLIGFSRQQVPVNGRNSLTIALSDGTTGLDEIVVVGYGTEKKRLNTGAIGSVKGAALEETHTLRVDQALQGQTAGIQVTSNSAQPGEGMKVRIRGTGTIGNSDPLYIVDGVPTGDISYLNSSDVASMDVLKDAASAAIYGSRAANGVVIITTKKGHKGAMQVSYDGFYGVQNPARKLPLLDAHEYAVILNEAAINSNRAPYFSVDQINQLGKGTDWQEAVFNKNAPTQSHTLNLSGGSEKSVYSSSLSYMKQDGTIGFPGQSQYERLAFRLSSEHNMYKDIVKFGENFTYTLSNKRGVGVGNIYNNTLHSIVNVSPLFPVYDSLGNYAKSPFNADEANPVAVMDFQNQNKNKTDRVLGNAYLEIKPIKGLTLRSDFGLDLNYTTNNSFLPVYDLATNITNDHSRATMGINRTSTWNWDNTISYRHDFGLHSATVLVGTTANETTTFFVNGFKEDVTIPDLDHSIINNGTNEDTKQINGNRTEDALLSYFGRVNYNYAEKYLFTAIFRRDGSTRFGANNRYGTFPSFSVGWVATNEDFMKMRWLDFLKVRASWGRNGNLPAVYAYDNIATTNYLYMATITSLYQDYYFGQNDTKFIGSSPDRVPNPDLKWETSEQVNAGFDAQLFKDFSLTLDWYRKTTKDWIITVPVPAIAGTKPPTVNGGSVKNEGVEIALGYNHQFGDFRFGINGNVTFNKNTVVDIPNPEKVIVGDANVTFVGIDELFRTQQGFPVGYFYGLKTNGIFQNEKEIQSYTGKNGTLIQPNAKPGDVRFVDLNGDGVIDSRDKTEIGNPNPDVSYGLNLNLGYKGFDLSVFLYGVSGNQVYSGIRDYAGPLSNYTTEILGRWHGEGTSNTLPRMTLGDEPNQNWTRSSDLYVKDASFLRVRSINLGYDFKRTLFPRLPMQQLRIYVSGSNLFTFTKYKGMDPEIGYGPYPWASGIDIGTYPQPKTVIVGLNARF
ncbi:TonB-dependent receptor [Chitinophaga agrisoli]|uniref:TonB-dependent receptor n=1 Tax=Chitinophaga agrisoli TaxID=2607653 RepID=A0A5B2VNZ7_9BACT|nr:TonB-dependent receptor [Chitinophaga agrisoli]KAA2240032.1 TonB-dependent receptor [Chitinophaga agrisoli]